MVLAAAACFGSRPTIRNLFLLPQAQASSGIGSALSLSRNHAVALGERGRLDRCFRRLAENLGTIRILTEW